jgi:phasin family protein
MSNETPKQPEHPFSLAMGQARTAAEDFTKMFADLKLPAMPDTEALLAAHRRNMEVLSAANRIALEGAQAVAKRHMEIMQQTMAELSETVRALSSTEGPQAKAAKQAELLKRAYERAVANTKEMSDLIQHANGEALAMLNQRFVEAMDEVKQLMEKANGAAKK